MTPKLAKLTSQALQVPQVSHTAKQVSRVAKQASASLKAPKQSMQAATVAKQSMIVPQAPKTRATKGTVAIENVKDRLRLRFRASGRQYSLTMGLSDTPEHRTLCKAVAAQIERDVVYGHFDTSLCKYRPAHMQIVKASENLLELWERFTAHRRPQIEQTTLITKYGNIKSHIEKLPKKTLADAAFIKDFWLENLSPQKCKSVLTMISACCKWALKAKLISHNPFAGMASEIRVPKDSRSHIDPFSAEERDVIVRAFDAHPSYAHYASFVRFLFFTGCRTSEAIGLKWKHVDGRRILFAEVITVACGKQITKGTKTGEAREFPINAQLRALLTAIKPKNATPDAFVFATKTGRPINAINFFNLVWTGRRKDGKFIPGIVSVLAQEGKIARYRPPYNTRHTFITLMLEAGFTPQEVARLVGNSPEILMQHYAGCTRKLTVPEF